MGSAKTKEHGLGCNNDKVRVSHLRSDLVLIESVTQEVSDA